MTFGLRHAFLVAYYSSGKTFSNALGGVRDQLEVGRRSERRPGPVATDPTSMDHDLRRRAFPIVLVPRMIGIEPLFDGFFDCRDIGRMIHI